MHEKKSQYLTIALFCGFLGVMLMLYLIAPKEEFSQREKRYLAQAPKLTWENLASGQWGSDVESYLADHIPGRDFFVGLNAYAQLLTGRQAGEDIWVRGDRLVEAPVEENAAAAARNMTAINSLAQNLGQQVDLMLIPSAGWALGAGEYRDRELIDSIYSLAQEGVSPLDVAEVFAGNPEYYYKTDHHWTSRGAYMGYLAYMDAAGREAVPEEAFQKTIAGVFQGSTYSRSALWLTKGEELELWQGSDALTVIADGKEPHPGVFYPERLEEADKYTVFLDGNHPLVRIQNPEKTGRLLVIRDSYSNSLGCFLAESYGEVVLVDLRYYKQPVSQLARQEPFDDILVCYSIGNFLTDSNFIFLK